ncbi:protein toll [Drosophila virilis]|uniref:protein toll n=1 Tax=Drosophila virilis TaxID=7244 RepID=UPI00139600B8|nr:protein toll [Drosophila virilis]
MKRTCPFGCVCTFERNELQFKIDCDSIDPLTHVPDLPIPIVGNAILYFNNKNLTELPNSTLYGYSNLRQLHLANNRLTHISLAQLPANLTYLDVSNNSLKTFDKNVLEFLSSRSGNIRLRISGNLWICDCDAEPLISFVANLSNSIDDREHIECNEIHFGKMAFLKKTDICGLPTNYSALLFGCLLGIAIIIMAYFYLKKSVIICLYERNLCISCISHPEPENSNTLTVDAFLAFSHMDSELVEEYIEKLEKGSRAFKLCYYQRDWLIGESIPACILKSIEESKRIIILMTKNFKQSAWGRFEFRMAVQATSIDQYKRLIIIVYPEVEDFNDLDSELRTYMKLNTYLRRDDPQFWRKLIFAMPHNHGNHGRAPINAERQAQELPLLRPKTVA